MVNLDGVFMIIRETDKGRFNIATLVILVRVCSGLIWSSAGPLLSLIMLQYSINRAVVSWYGSVAPVVLVGLAIPVGIVGLRMGAKRIFALGALLQASCIIAPFCSNFVALLLTRAVFAAGVAMTAPIVSRIYVEWFSPRVLPLLNGLTMALVHVGGSLAFLASIPIATALSWQLALTLYGVLALASALAWLFWGKESQNKAFDRSPRFALNAAADDSTNILHLLKQRRVILLVISLIGPYALGSAIGFWLPTYYHEVFDKPLAISSSITATLSVTGAVACFVGGILPMRLGIRKPFLVIPGLTMGLLALGCFLFNNTALILVSVALYGIFSSLQMASVLSIPMELPGLTPRTGAIVLALTLGAANIGNFIGPLIVGQLADLTGSYIPGFVICCVLSLTLFVAGVGLPETGPAARKPALKKVLEPSSTR
jgi:CP family cyanate transporter-like MFS transporter